MPNSNSTRLSPILALNPIFSKIMATRSTSSEIDGSTSSEIASKSEESTSSATVESISSERSISTEKLTERPPSTEESSEGSTSTSSQNQPWSENTEKLTGRSTSTEESSEESTSTSSQNQIWSEKSTSSKSFASTVKEYLDLTVDMDFESDFAGYTNLSDSDPMEDCLFKTDDFECDPAQTDAEFQDWLMRTIDFELDSDPALNCLQTDAEMEEWLIKNIDFELDSDPALNCLHANAASIDAVHHPASAVPDPILGFNILLGVTRALNIDEARLIIPRLHQMGNLKVLDTTEALVGISSLPFELLSDSLVNKTGQDELIEWTTRLIVIADKDFINQVSLGHTGDNLTSIVDNYKGNGLIVSELTEDAWILPSTMESVNNLKSKGYNVVNTVEGASGIIQAVANWY